jgi:hypothetical protein
MTNQEALRLIKATEFCFVVWSAVKREVVAVVPQRRDAPDAVSALGPFPNSDDGSDVYGRFLDSATVSISTLLKEQADMAAAAERRNTLRFWRTCETDDLIVLLETGDFPPQTSVRRDSRILIDEIYYARADGLSSPQVARLEAVVARRHFSVLGSAVVYDLECRLAVMLKDRPRLERLWRLHGAKGQGFSYDFAIAAGDLALDLPDVIEYFVETVEHNGPLEPRFFAMLALGKIGASAGPRAAETIATHIYDSSESVSKLRDRVLLRIRMPSSNWQMCDACVRGMVPDVHGFPMFDRCSRCCGLGHTLGGG